MGRSQSPGYFRDVEKWRGSIAVQRMSFAEQGIYVKMLDEQWLHGPLPDDPHAVADLIAISSDQAAQVVAAWEVIRRKFVVDRRQPDRIYNVALERTRRAQKKNRWQHIEAGRRGGEASARNRQTRKAEDAQRRLSGATATVERNQPNRSEVKRSEERERDRARVVELDDNKRPLFTGQRLTVFGWMVEKCTAILGSEADAEKFDLTSWFHDLDRRAVDTGLVIPSRAWDWLQAQLVAEARRRGLALTMATPVKPATQAELEAAAKERFRATNGLCRHQPPCDFDEQCLDKWVQTIRARKVRAS